MKRSVIELDAGFSWEGFDVGGGLGEIISWTEDGVSVGDFFGFLVVEMFGWVGIRHSIEMDDSVYNEVFIYILIWMFSIRR